MKKINLIKNPELFQGEKEIKESKNYFEGWYFKNSNTKENITFIPGISKNEEEEKAFIQVITNDASYFFSFDSDDFIYHEDPFYIQIKENYFSKDELRVHLQDKKQKINIIGNLLYTNHDKIKTNALNPNIMGPFSYIPFMECNHAILSMKNSIYGEIKVNKKKIKFNKGIGYLEKDWGISFPKTYLWCQANSFKNESASFMFSIANIPFKLFSFRGMICVFHLNGKEYKFTTYNNARVIQYKQTEKEIKMEIKKGEYTLAIHSNPKKSLKLAAPVKGKMNKDVFETITAAIEITLKEGEKIIFKEKSKNSGLEIV